jgi:outer membrane protein OmpA-like peptidoglycan-associated protein
MLISSRGGQPRSARDRVQAYRDTVSGTSGLRFHIAPAVPAALGLLLAGCSSFPSSMNPVSWWHDLQGGKIAEERPPPPGADQPYPNLATVPPKPAEPDRAALANIANGLIADRTNTQHANEAAPIADPSLPSASPALFGKGTVPPPPPPAPPGTETASASLPAADAPPAPPSRAPPAAAPAPAPAKAPVAAVQSAALPPPAADMTPPSPAAAPPAATTPAPATPAAAAPATNAPLAPPGASAQPTAAAAPSPPLPTTPPPPPNLASSAPAAAAPVAAAAPEQSAAPPAANAANTVNVTFVGGSAELPATAASTLKALASRRGSGIIAVTGYGDASSNDPDAQSAALTLGLSRAQAMAAALTSAGVPRSAVQVDAEAIGRGGAARLVK